MRHTQLLRGRLQRLGHDRAVVHLGGPTLPRAVFQPRQATLRGLPQSMHPLSVEGWTSPQEELDDLTPVAWLVVGREVEPVQWLADSEAQI